MITEATINAIGSLIFKITIWLLFAGLIAYCIKSAMNQVVFKTALTFIANTINELRGKVSKHDDSLICLERRIQSLESALVEKAGSKIGHTQPDAPINKT